MTTDVLLLILGLVLLVGGGDALVRGASALAYRLGISPLIVGLTVVAFGTSAPELAVNVAGALSGKGELSFGNVMGSNIANIALVLGATALIRPIALQREVIVREVPMMSLAAMAALILSQDLSLGDARGDMGDSFSRADGFVFLLFFAIFLYYTVGDALRQRSGGRRDQEIAGLSVPRAVTLTVFGLAALVVGGRLTVDSASSLALAMGISQAVVGLTVVAVGTSLPELVTSMIGVYRGETDMAVGNVVGSNIFNILFVLGTTSAIHEVPVPAGGTLDILVVLALSIGLLPLSFNADNKLMRKGGALLLVVYFGYLGWRAFG